ncbi:MAG: Dabb family protein [Actinobacteria bacterium]|nr:Dabb family protein [Actinomycetota bacterium]
MIRHVVLLKWNEGVGDAHSSAAGDALDQLPGLIPEIVSYQHGPDLGTAVTNYDYVVTATFADIGDYLVYRDHPRHKEVVNTYLAPYSTRCAAQFSLD